jgi:mycofactocin system glycosyltransferase
MNGFSFSLADTTSLEKDAGGFYLVSRLPLKILRINKALFHLLNHIRDGGELSEYKTRNPALDVSKAIRSLLYLVSRGYLQLDRVAVEDYPSVSIIIPVKDQPDEIFKCLRSLKNLKYPDEKLEIIVIDDGSESDVAVMAESRGVNFIRRDQSRGPAACRNIGVAESHGDILAFIDADCTATPGWLRELIPFFRAHAVGAVGGYVDGYYRESYLDKYEAVSSSLNMGKRLLMEGDSDATFYVPTANMLVTRDAFSKTGGFNESLHVGEDVDFCWRLRKSGYSLLYIPHGTIAHKHRNELLKMLKRRGDYGTSEAILYRTHHDKKKSFSVAPFAALSLLAFVLTILLLNPYPLIAMPVLFGIDLYRRSLTLRRAKMTISLYKTALSALRSYYSFCYFVFFHLIRYYLILFIGFGFLWHPLWILGVLMIVQTSVTDYFVKKPPLRYPFFLFFYLLEHLAYQTGVFWGCLRLRYFGSYLLSFKRS